MPQISRTALVPFSAEQMYQLVNDVKSYPDFLPGCTGSRVLEFGPTQMTAAVDVSKAGISKTFTTRNTLTSNQSILMSLVDGPFKKLIGGWKFIPLSPEACKIEFHLDFEFTNKLIEMALAGSSKSWPPTWCRRSLRAPKRSTVPANIRVEVAYALPEKQYLQRVTLDEGRRSSRRLSPAGYWPCVMISIWRRTSWVSTVVRLSCMTKFTTATGSKSIAR
jgi:ribosome-associated toxin RatA of RatAB toxin-antitoxin module